MDLSLIALVLLSACGGPVWTAPDYCPRNCKCPQFTVVEKHQDFEERLYAPAKWIGTPMGGSEASDLMAAHTRLKNVAIEGNAWPVLITVTNGHDLTYSWFVPPDKNQTGTDTVTVWSRPEVTVYVRLYGGTPSIKSAKDNAQTLYDDLKAAEKPGADVSAYAWAGYESYWSFTHHNEIWVEKQ